MRASAALMAALSGSAALATDARQTETTRNRFRNIVYLNDEKGIAGLNAVWMLDRGRDETSHCQP
jgi:hypothetical protein